MATLRAASVHGMAGTVSESDHLYQLVAHLVEAPKWWETEGGAGTGGGRSVT
ncbi:MAG: hypothetical protein M3P83_04630 [Actinomycetota bacterium]|nr:hypothetical protein [Actinomycetota bacterium]